jgi:hypothetical protein
MCTCLQEGTALQQELQQVLADRAALASEKRQAEVRPQMLRSPLLHSHQLSSGHDARPGALHICKDLYVMNIAVEPFL